MDRVLILANFDLGLYNFRKELIQSLLSSGIKVYISLPYGTLVYKLEEMGCQFIETKVDRRGMNPLKEIGLLFSYRKMIKQVKPDLVITYTVKPNLYGGLACRLKHIPYAANITGLGTAFQKKNLLKKVITTLYRSSLKKSGAVLFENEDNRKTFLDAHIVPEAKCQVMNGAGVNIEEYPFYPMPRFEIIRFIFIGRIMKEKGIDELIEAAERIREEFLNVEFSILGSFEEDYGERMEHLSIKGIVTYHGFQEDIRPFVKEAHCFVLPSYHEGMANTLLECGAMGRPLITSDISGCREAVVEGANGFLCRVKDSGHLYEKLKVFILLPAEQKIRMGIASRNHMEQVFEKKKVVRKTIEIMERVERDEYGSTKDKYHRSLLQSREVRPEMPAQPDQSEL